MDDLIVRRAEVFRDKQGIDLLTEHCVEALDPIRREVSGRTASGQVFSRPYDALLLACGADAIIPALEGIDLPGVLPLKTLADGRAIQSLIDAKPVSKVVILGMGYVALEMCEALRNLGLTVTLVKPRSRFMPWLQFDLAAQVKAAIERAGAEVLTGCAVGRIEGADGGLQVVGEAFSREADLILVATGVTPNSRIAAEAGLDLGAAGAIAVDRHLKTSDDHIFAAGDCADAFHVVTGEKTWIPLALRANRAGWAVADNVCGKPTALTGVAGTAVFKVFDMEVAKTGLNLDEAEAAGFDAVENVIKSRSRAHGHPGGDRLIWVNMIADRRSGRLLGVQMVGADGVAHRINAPAVALHAGLTVAQFAQADLAYAPPFGPTWDPMLTAANQVLKKL